MTITVVTAVCVCVCVCEGCLWHVPGVPFGEGTLRTSTDAVQGGVHH